MDLKIGKKVWIANQSTPTEVTIRFVGDKEIACDIDGKLEVKQIRELYETEAEAQAAINGLLMTVFCREVNRTTGEVMVYPIETEIDNGLVTALRIRGRMNPELTYGVSMKIFFEEHKDEMKDMEVLNRMFENNNVVLL